MLMKSHIRYVMGIYSTWSTTVKGRPPSTQTLRLLLVKTDRNDAHGLVLIFIVWSFHIGIGIGSWLSIGINYVVSCATKSQTTGRRWNMIMGDIKVRCCLYYTLFKIQCLALNVQLPKRLPRRFQLVQFEPSEAKLTSKFKYIIDAFQYCILHIMANLSEKRE